MHWLIRSQDSVPSGSGWLAAYERQWADRLRFVKRRNEYLLRRFAAKEAVARAIGLCGLPAPEALARIEVRNHPSGAPYVLVDGEPAGLEISLSDRMMWVICLLDKQIAGCDLELVEPRSPGFVGDFLTGAERSYVDNSADPAETANLIWSAKESALKVLRTGLRLDTREVEVSLQSGRHGEWSALGVKAPGGRWFPGWWRRGGGFVLTVVTRHQTPPPQPLDDFTGPFSAPAPR